MGEEVVILFTDYLVIKHLPMYDYIVHGVVIIISEDNLLSPLKVPDVNGLLNKYGFNSRNFIIKFVCTIVKAIGSYLHLCRLSHSWV